MTGNGIVPPSLQARLDRARNKALFTDVFGNRFDADTVRQHYETNCRWTLGSPDALQVPQSELQGLISELDRTLELPAATAYSETRTSAVSPPPAKSAASYRGGLRSGQGLSPRISIHFPISADRNSGHVVQNVGDSVHHGWTA